MDFPHSFIHSFIQSVSQPASQPASQPVSQSVSQSVSKFDIFIYLIKLADSQSESLKPTVTKICLKAGK